MKIILLYLATVMSIAANPLISLSGNPNTGGGPDVTAPEIALSSINATTYLITWSENVTRGAGYNDSQFELDINGGVATLTYVGGDGSNVFTYTSSIAAANGDPVTLSFDGTPNSIEDGAGNDLAAVVAEPVTNTTPGAASFASEVLADSPVAYWKFNEPSGTSINDEIGTSDLTTFNGPTLGVAGMVDGDTAIEFVGTSSQYALIPSNLGINAYPFTLECVVKTSTAETQTLVQISRTSSSQHKVQMLVGSTGFASIVIRVNSYVAATGTVNVADGDPHHIVCVFESSTSRKLYVDGVLDATSTTSSLFPSTMVNTSVGMDQDLTPESPATAVIGHVAIYNTALDATRVAAHFNALP